jgi:hypothetical protein
MAQDSFKPAEFAGLRVGKATVTEAKKRLGQPRDSFRGGMGTDWLYYSDVGPVPGKVEIIADSKTGLIEGVSVYPDNLTLKEATKLFGPNYRTVRYALDECLSSGGDGAPIYESKDGPLEYVVYSDQGIAIAPDGEQVRSIEYLSRPLGAKKSQCEDKGAQTPKARTP